MTAQPVGFRPSALWVTTHGQQAALLVGRVLPFCRGAVSIFYSPQLTGQEVVLNVEGFILESEGMGLVLDSLVSSSFTID